MKENLIIVLSVLCLVVSGYLVYKNMETENKLNNLQVSLENQKREMETITGGFGMMKNGVDDMRLKNNLK